MRKHFIILLAIFLFLACEKKNPVIPIVINITPKIEIFADTVTEGIDDFLLLEIKLNSPPEKPFFVEYETVSATAKAGEDFESISGILEFTRNEESQNQSIFVEIIDNVFFEEEEFFEIHFTADTSVQLNTNKVAITIIDTDIQHTDNEFIGYVTPKQYDGWKLFWADEFGGNVLNLDNWTQADRGNWYNNELQYYQPENSIVENGILTIIAKPETIGSHRYSSSRMWTEHKVFFKYGRIDIRAKLPFSQGLWPALWMMGENRDIVGWPKCGEIDIMELRGHTPNTISSTIHYKNSASNHSFPPSKKHTLSTGDFSEEFHVFSMIWNEQKIEFFVDDSLYNTLFYPNFKYHNGDNHFLKDFYILMNVAVGGDFGGNPDATTIWPQKMEVDYVRVFQEE